MNESFRVGFMMKEVLHAATIALQHKKNIKKIHRSTREALQQQFTTFPFDHSGILVSIFIFLTISY